jgi:hypothetical protein
MFGIPLLFVLVTCRSQFDYIFVVSRYLVLLSTLPEFLHSFYGL